MGRIKRDWEGSQGREDNNKGCVNELVTVVRGESLALLGAFGTVQNTPKSCPIEEHGS